MESAYTNEMYKHRAINKHLDTSNKIGAATGNSGEIGDQYQRTTQRIVA